MSDKHGDFTPVVKAPAHRASPAEVVERTPALRSSPLMVALGEGRERVLRLAIARRYADKVVLYEHGDTGGSLFFIIAGVVRLFGKTGDRLLEIGEARPGEVVGSTEVLEGQLRRRLSVIAQGPVEALEIARELLHAQGTLSPAVAAVLTATAEARADALKRME